LTDCWHVWWDWLCSWFLEWLADHYSNESGRNESLWENQIELIDLFKWIEDESLFYLSDRWSVAFRDTSDRKIIVETKCKTRWTSLILESSCSILYESWLSYLNHWTTQLVLSKDHRWSYKDWHIYVRV